MKFCPKGRLLRWALPVVVLLAVGLAARGALEKWAQNVEASGRFEMALFRYVAMPAGPVMVRRPPAQSRLLLDRLAAQSPKDADVYLMRARVEEESLDFAAAERDWKKRAELLLDHVAGEMALADFYQRRLQPNREIQALLAAARAPSSASNRLLPATGQRSWRAFQRIFEVIQRQALPAADSTETYRAWMARYPKEPSVYSRFFDFLLAQKQFGAAAELIGTYEKAFPDDRVFPVRAQASLADARGSIDEALALYDHAFQPLWPPELIQDYFKLLKKTHRLRDYLRGARAGVSAQPQDLSAASRLFYYYQQEGNLDEARRALEEYRLRMESAHATWSATELWQLGKLFEAIHDDDQAAHCYYALYSLPGAGAGSAEKSLAALLHLLFSAPEQPIKFGEEDFSMVRDIGTLDPDPGFLNGIVSLLLNTQRPAGQYFQAENSSRSYFHSVRAAELVALFDRRFPRSARRTALHAQLIEAYANYGEDAAVIRAAREFLKEFPAAPQRLHVALLLADALARTHQVDAELALYDQLLDELAAEAQHVPLGSPTTREYSSRYSSPAPETSRLPFEARPAARQANGPRSPDYARVLDRAVARLVELKRPMQVLALFRREIDRNPNDPGLYERLATFLDQNHLGDQTGEVYRRAMKQFSDRSWTHRLARWYLRRREKAQFQALSEQVIKTFSGSDLESYFRDVVSSPSLGAVLYRQLNLYAHQRFPHNLVFVRNLLQAYTAKATYDRAAWEELLRKNWYFDSDLRSRYFSYLSQAGDLQAELEAVRHVTATSAQATPEQLAHDDPAAAEFIAEGNLWRCHYETAAPLMRALADEYPSDFSLDRRTSNLYRSLAAFNPANTAVAVGIEQKLARYEPTNAGVLTRIGDIYADRNLFAQARPYWNRVARLAPGTSEGYLNAATVFWDYFKFQDALRLIREGRAALHEPALFAYQAGAVYEGERDYPRALREYVRGALAGGEYSESRARLLDLAQRPKLQALVDRLTATAASGPHPTAAAVSLRVDVLNTLKRRDDLGKFLSSLAASATSPELLEQIQSAASQQGFPAIQTSALERQIALSRDPVEQMGLRLKLANLQESQHHVTAARQTLESLYAQHPRILGVVRATVDFYWRHKMADQAIQTLLAAAQVSYPALKTRFTFEAAGKATEAGKIAQSRALLAGLLQADPYNAQDLAAMAETYARVKDNAGLRDFYLAKIGEFSKAPLSPAEKTERVAGLRRGLIPALTRLKDYSGALDQYIEILNRYPEDQNLTDEVAAYADQHNLRKRLLGYYQKTAAASPKDFRWPMVLARLETYFEDYPAAIADYAQAHRLRPGRSDLLIADAQLQERLLRFDAAAQTYTTIYKLTYQDPHWMEKVAEIRARQGKTAAAVAALKKALIAGRPSTPGIYFRAAARAEHWNMLKEARQFAERGVTLAGGDLLTDGSYWSGVQTYAQVMTRLRQYAPALSRLESSTQVEHPERAYNSLNAALHQVGRIVETDYTPEERTAFQTFLEQQKQMAAGDTLERVLLPLATDAGLGGLEAQWRFELMMRNPGTAEARTQESRLIQLQRRRMKYAELGHQLEKYWAAMPYTPNRDRPLIEAAESYRAGAMPSDELRTLGRAFSDHALSEYALNRYFQLLLVHNPERLIEIARTGDPVRDQTRNRAANFAVASGDRALALQAITARGEGLPPVWTRAFTGLVGLYYSDTAPPIGQAFQNALGGGTIGERVGKPVNRQEHLAGHTWFYYSSRYGEFLTLAQQGSAEDFLPATVEATPANPKSYFELAEFYRQAGEPERALADYRHTLELDPSLGEADDRMAQILWQQGKRAEAAERWKQALEAFERLQNSGRVPPEFWEDVRSTLTHIGSHQLLPQVRTEADRLLRTYIHRNGAYQIEPLLKGALAAASDPAAGVEWILELSQSAPNPLDFLGGIVRGKWIPPAARAAIYRRILAEAQQQVEKSHGAMRNAAQSTLDDWQVNWIGFLLDAHEIAQAQAALTALPEKTRKARTEALAPIEIRLAAKSGQLDALLEKFRTHPNQRLSNETLRTAAAALRKDGESDAASRVLEYLYTRALQQRNLVPANFLGLAELRLKAGQVAPAVKLLQRMVLVEPQPFASLKDAGNLLVRYGQSAEALPFFSQRVEAAPWDSGAWLLLGKAEAASGHKAQAAEMLKRLAASREATYAQRAAAARYSVGFGAKASELGSAELNLLASGGPANAAAARQPFFVIARVEAAERAKDPQQKMDLLREAIGINPEESSARIAFFQAAEPAGHFQLALSAMRPLLVASPYSGEYAGRGYYGGSGGGSFLQQTKLTPERKAALARQIASAEEKLGSLNDAERFLRIAAEMKISKSVKAQIESELHRVEKQLKLQTRDARRRPSVAAQLEQANAVRPRLLPLRQAKAKGGTP